MNDNPMKVLITDIGIQLYRYIIYWNPIKELPTFLSFIKSVIFSQPVGIRNKYFILLKKKEKDFTEVTYNRSDQAQSGVTLSIKIFECGHQIPLQPQLTLSPLP